MERLTMPHGICQMASTEYCLSHRDCYSCEHGRKVFRGLAAYEDTGLEPEEVLPKDKADEIALKLMRLADLESICSYTRLRELAEADRAGRLVVLPYKVKSGD